MAGETILKRVSSTPQVLEANGAAISNDNVAQADDATLDLSSGVTGGWAPHCMFVLTLQYAVNPTENASLSLWAAFKEVDGASIDETPPETGTGSWRNNFLAAAPVNNVTTQQVLTLFAWDIPHPKMDIYIRNDATGQQVPAGWTLKAYPLLMAPQA